MIRMLPYVAGLMLAGAVGCTQAGLPAIAKPAIVKPPAEPEILPVPFARGDAADLGIDLKALHGLRMRAEQSHSDAVVVVKDGKLVGEWYFGKQAGPIETMSLTKSVVSLAVGRLIDDGDIKSIEVPVHHFYPEWKQGKKNLITMKHLLNHTSGLQTTPNTQDEIYKSPDFIKLALAAELANDPGARFFYNNKAVNLLAGIVHQASGQKLDAYLDKILFAPLGIRSATWAPDPAGNPQCMAGLRLEALDLARIGQMLANDGVWQGQRIISSRWITLMSRSGQDHFPSAGLLWWLLPEWQKWTITEKNLELWRSAGVTKEFCRKVAPLVGIEFTRKDFGLALARLFGPGPGMDEWHNNTWRRGLPDGTPIIGPVRGYFAQGHLGQYLVILPEENLVALRQRRIPENQQVKPRDTFSEFPQMVVSLLRKP